MSFESDLTVFFNTDDFASTATIGANSFKVILDRNYQAIDAGESYISSYQIVCTCKQSDITSYVTLNATVVIDSVSYKVIDIRKDSDHRIGIVQLQEL